MSEFRVFGNFPETCRVSNSVLTTVGLLSIMSYYWFKCNSIVWYGFGTSLMLLDAKFRNPWSLGVCVCVFALRPSRLRAGQHLNDTKVLQECKHAGKHGFGTKGSRTIVCILFF